MAISFTLLNRIDMSLDMSRVQEKLRACNSQRDAEQIVVSDGNREVELGEMFTIVGDTNAGVQVWNGDFSRADGMAAGLVDEHIVINGDVGHRAGARMVGGHLRIQGNVRNGLGSAMQGGEIWLHGNAGDRVGAAEAPSEKGMRGGKIFVSGTAGDMVGFRMRRGTIVVGGCVGKLTGYQMLAGTIVCADNVELELGREMRRGTILALNSKNTVVASPTFRLSGQFQFSAIEVLLRQLQKSLNASIFANKNSCLTSEWQQLNAILENRFHQHWNLFYGDHLHGGRGEILTPVTSA